MLAVGTAYHFALNHASTIGLSLDRAINDLGSVLNWSLMSAEIQCTEFYNRGRSGVLRAPVCDAVHALRINVQRVCGGPITLLEDGANFMTNLVFYMRHFNYWLAGENS